jgi:hypothetical protein
MEWNWWLMRGIGGGIASVIWAQCSFAQSSTKPPDLIGLQCTAEQTTADILSKPNRLLSFGLPCQETLPFNENGRTLLQNLQKGFDLYSWLTFIALNSPDHGPITQARPDTPTQWERSWEDKLSLIQLSDVMRVDANDPSNRSRVIPPNCRAQYKPGMMVVNMSEETYNQPFKTGPLIDQHGNYALFDILMNKDMFDFIVKHGLYSKAQQESAENSELKIDFPAGNNAADMPGAIMIKVAWRILTPQDDKSKFHTADALVSMPATPDETSEPPCLHETLGLVGFHVAHKTTTRLQWIWTTFEHVDNAPDQRDIETRSLKSSYNFFDPSCNSAKCPVNGTPPRPWKPNPALHLKFSSSFHSQIVRVIPIENETRKLNKVFQSILGNSVWANYELVSTQWPSDRDCGKQTDPANSGAPMAPATAFGKEPDMTCAPAPTFLANSTLETFSQGETPLASSSCMACHGNAVSFQRRQHQDQREQRTVTPFFSQSDFTFMLEKAHCPRPDPLGSSRCLE